MKTWRIKRQLIIITLLIFLLPITAFAMAPWPGRGGDGRGCRSVPEPSTVLLLAAGGGVLLIKRFWKNKK
jgi:hypothetical protein